MLKKSWVLFVLLFVNLLFVSSVSAGSWTQLSTSSIIASGSSNAHYLSVTPSFNVNTQAGQTYSIVYTGGSLACYTIPSYSGWTEQSSIVPGGYLEIKTSPHWYVAFLYYPNAVGSMPSGATSSDGLEYWPNQKSFVNIVVPANNNQNLPIRAYARVSWEPNQPNVISDPQCSGIVNFALFRWDGTGIPTDPPMSACGDGIKSGNEVCDGFSGCSGNQICSADCKTCKTNYVANNTCGNGKLDWWNAKEKCERVGSLGCSEGSYCKSDCSECVSNSNCDRGLCSLLPVPTKVVSCKNDGQCSAVYPSGKCDLKYMCKYSPKIIPRFWNVLSLLGIGHMVAPPPVSKACDPTKSDFLVCPSTASYFGKCVSTSSLGTCKFTKYSGKFSSSEIVGLENKYLSLDVQCANDNILADVCNKPAVCEEKIYNLGGYSVSVDDDKTDDNSVSYSMQFSVQTSSNPLKNGKVNFGGQFKMNKMNFLAVDRIKTNVDKPGDILNKVAITNADGVSQNIIKVALTKLIDKPGETTGTITFTGESVDTLNKKWKVSVSSVGSIFQKYIIGSNQNRVINEVWGSYNRNQYEDYANLFLKLIGLVVDDKDTTRFSKEVSGDPIPGKSVHYYNLQKWDEGALEMAWWDMSVTKVYTPGDTKLLSIKVYQKMPLSSHKHVEYTAPTDDLETIRAMLEKCDSVIAGKKA